MNFKDKIIVVTGGSSGIGKQIVIDLVDQGALVCAISRNKKKLDKLLLESANSKLFGFVCDVTKKDQTSNIFNDISKKFGNIYGLVNNVGVNPSRNNILNTTFDDWEKTLNVNLTGAYLCSKLVISQMLKKGHGSIVNISSIAGINALENRFAYMTSKWGLLGLSSSLAIDFAKYNIRVNSICPGYVKTPLVSKYLENLPKPNKKRLIESHLIGRLGKPKDISKAVSFLLSEDASWITGTILPVDGGYSVGKKVDDL